MVFWGGVFGQNWEEGNLSPRFDPGSGKRTEIKLLRGKYEVETGAVSFTVDTTIRRRGVHVHSHNFHSFAIFINYRQTFTGVSAPPLNVTAVCIALFGYYKALWKCI